MSTSAHTILPSTPIRNGYGQMTLEEVVARIANQGDPLALSEFHEHRTVFPGGGNDEPTLFAEFLWKLRCRALQGKHVNRDRVDVFDTAYDITLLKFTNLQASHPTSGKREIDCRGYFRAPLLRVLRENDSDRPMSQIELERRIASALERFVRRHFYLSLKEATRRPGELSTRYVWEVNGRRIPLYFPAGFPADKARWLFQNIGMPDLSRPGERARIQQIVNDRLGRGGFVQFAENLEELSDDPRPALHAALAFTNEMSIKGLARTVAEEKARNIDMLRPSIRVLGKKKLAALILSIFKELSRGSTPDIELAARFGLSKATYSRFAGSRWNIKPVATDKTDVPDLWVNTAQTLAGNPIFTEAAREAGVWNKVCATARMSGTDPEVSQT